MALAVKRMTELELDGRRLLIREDLNAPIKDGKVTSAKRLSAALPTIEYALQHGARVALISHLGRPRAGTVDAALSLAPVATLLGELLGRSVPLVTDWLDGIDVQPGDVVLCENVRFQAGETPNEDALARRLAALCDIYVMDAFGTAHRAHASTHGVARHAPVACAGPLLIGELEALAKALEEPARPVVAIIGGSKVSTKLAVLGALASSVDELIVGGGIANTLLAAAGADIGRSLQESQMHGFAAKLLAREFGRAAVPLPIDVVVAESMDAAARGTVKSPDRLAKRDMILDIGPDTAREYGECLSRAGTILWNGPVGVFEHPEFSQGTRSIAKAIAASGAFSIAGGGDTLAAIEQFGVVDEISYLSTGGGAFLQFLEGKPLPALEMLEARA
ncbi:MAG: phosphoglycerate kinase [Gammaproteobacteria bacterium]|nr:phosphoglycerate kinase [Gammaproteobacteria bacterium]